MHRVMGITNAHEHLVPPIKSSDDLANMFGALDSLESTEADEKRERIRA